MTTGTATATADAAPMPAGQLSHRRILEILTGLMLGLFLAALDQTIVASAIRTIGDDLHGLSVQAWVTTAYLITSTITTPLYGKLSDLYGRKQFFLAAISIFIFGSALCSFATSMYMLAGFRALQGIGAGGLFSLALAILGDIVPPRERARYQGYFLAVFGTSSVLGPVIGGFFAGRSSILGISGWRWVFLVNVPIGLVALIVVARTLNLPHNRRDHRLDFAGAASISVALVPLLTVAEQGRSWGWGSGRSMLCYVIGGIGLAAFIWAEARMGEDALIPLRFFRNRTFALTSIAAVVTGMGMFGGIASLPLYLQIVRGASPTQSGLQLIPLTLGIMLGSVVSGQLISRIGRYKIYPIIGSGLMTVGMGLLHFITADTAYWQTGLCMFVFGFGLGNVMQPITLAVQNAMPPQDIGVATSSSTFFRQMGGTLGVAVFLSILFSSVGANIKSAFAASAQTPAFQAAVNNPAVQANPANRSVLTALSGQGGDVSSSTINDTSFISHLDKALARPFQVGFSTSMDLVFLVAAGVLVLAFVVLLFLPEIPLRTKSAMAAREPGSPVGGMPDQEALALAAGEPAADSGLAAAAPTPTPSPSPTPSPTLSPHHRRRHRSDRG
jgi:EmrB/QacA subfamily drug resistance transporter